MAAKRSGHEEEAVSLMVGMLRLDRNSRSAKLPSVKTVGVLRKKSISRYHWMPKGLNCPRKAMWRRHSNTRSSWAHFEN